MTKKKIIILGGLGFIGKNLYKGLRGGHDVTILTDRIQETDDGFLNSEVRNKIVVGSILNSEFIENALKGYDVIFSLAGSSGASDSIKNPYHDLDSNLKGHLNVLEACRKNNSKALLIFPSSRLVYGKPEIIPVNENHELKPESIYAIHKLTAEHYYLLYQRLYGIPGIIFRISNPFGPYQKFGSNHYGILNWFIHNATSGADIEIYGDGSQQRDFIHVDDIVDLFQQSLDKNEMVGKIYNVGYGKGISLNDAARMIAKYTPATKIKYKPWPELDKKIETGDYISDIRLLQNEIGWKPKISFEEGIRETVKFYCGKSK